MPKTAAQQGIQFDTIERAVTLLDAAGKGCMPAFQMLLGLIAVGRGGQHAA